MNLLHFSQTAAVIVALVVPGAVSPAYGQDNQPQRTQEQIMADLNAASQELQPLAASPAEVLSDPQRREELAPNMVPALRRMIELFDELNAVEPQPESDRQGRTLAVAVLDALGDEAAAAELQALAKSDDEQSRAQVRTARLIVSWWTAGRDAEAQSKLLDEVEKLAEADPAEESLAQALMLMIREGAADRELRKRAEGILVENLQGPTADQARAHLQGGQRLRALEDKPLVLEGKLHDGADFSTEQWKGQVILVDFWATWCGPCIAELPRVKKVYEQYHAQGLQVLGVSCDNRLADLERFLKENPDMPWPQMFDADNPGWHALAKEYGVQGIPTMFLIDRKGVVRSVEARGNFEQMIPRLLAEPAE